VDLGVDADSFQAAEVQLLQVLGVRLQDHLILVVLVQPVGVLAIAAVGGPPRRLNVGHLPGLGAQGAQHRHGRQRARADLDVVGLQNRTALTAPIVVQFQDQALK
jgi:hypothetical protein